jgi:DNA-binding NarL/FixJ family response regulator
MIRIMLVDDHAAVRAGLVAVLGREPDLEPVAATEGNGELWPHFHRTRPDLVLLDYHLPGQSSLQICRRLKAVLPRPRVAFYSAYADASLTVPLRLAGADGLVSKGAPAAELFDVLRRVGNGETVLPPVTPDLQEASLGAVDPEDRVIAALLLSGALVADIGDVLRVDPCAARMRVERLLGRLGRSHPADAGAARAA